MKEIEKIEEYLVSKGFRIDYQNGFEQYWSSYQQEESVLINLKEETATVSRLFDEDRIFTTLKAFKLELF